MAATVRKIAISTGGGDAPGLNAVICAVTMSALNRGWSCYGVRDGYNGLLFPEQFPDGGLVPLSRDTVRSITALGGTILGTTNRGNPLHFPVRGADGKMTEIDRSDELIRAFALHEVDALVAIGGDGSLAIASVLAKKGLRVIGVPKTIDNDLDRTVITFGFDTAVSFATECIDRLHSTAEAHRRVMVVEVMGRYAGWIALNAGIAASADAILIPEIPYDLTRVAAAIRRTEERRQKHAIIVVAEGARPKQGDVTVLQEATTGRQEKLGGVGNHVAQELEALSSREARVVVLGHLLRGGTPTSFDRLLALRFGAAAVRAIEDGQSGVMVALNPPTVDHVPLDEAIGRMKTVPLDSDTVLTGRDLGICFGD
jgi:6-phosphofructokinase 1